jgi:hypothetical protein
MTLSFGEVLPRRVFVTVTLIALAACDSDSAGPDPGPGAVPDILLVTSVADASGVDGSSFIQTVSLDQGSITNADAFEQVFFAYVSMHGNDVIVTQGLSGDQAVRYSRGADGRLTEAGRMNLAAGGFGAGVVFASASKAYVPQVYAGKILVFNPQTMSVTGEIDLTTLGIARNPSNPQDKNPEPAVLAIRGGKLYVALQQLVTGFVSADGADIAVFDVETHDFEGVIHDDRATAPGRYGYNETMFVDEAGDLYVYCVASFGFAPGQTAGILRIRSGESTFDPSYFVDLTNAAVAVTGGRIGLLNGFAYGGAGVLYALALVPPLQSNPPNYATDRAIQAVRITLATGQVDVLPLPLNNAISTGIAIYDGRVLFGLSTATGVGIYSYDPATNQVSNAPVLTTVGDPTHVMVFGQ